MSQQINLYNVALAPKIERVSARLTLRAMVACAVCALVAGLFAQIESGRVRRLAISQAAQLAAAQDDAMRMAREAAARTPDSVIMAELESVQALVDGRRQVLARLLRGDLGDSGGVSEYLRAFARQRLDGVWITGLSIGGAGRDITVDGRTRDAQLLPRYLERLRDETALRGRAFATLAVHKPSTRDEAGSSAEPDYLAFRLATADGTGGGVRAGDTGPR